MHYDPISLNTFTSLGVNNKGSVISSDFSVLNVMFSSNAPTSLSEAQAQAHLLLPHLLPALPRAPHLGQGSYQGLSLAFWALHFLDSTPIFSLICSFISPAPDRVP